MAAITAAVTWFGLRAQRAKPSRRWPVIAVGLLTGLVAGLAIIQAIWLGDRYPHRRRLIDATSVLVASGLMLAVAYSVYGPPFGIGTQIESGTIVRPEQGYTITLPDDWRVEDISGVEKVFGESFDPGFEPDLLAVDADGESFLMLVTLDLGEVVAPGVIAFSTVSELKADPYTEDANWEMVELDGRNASRIDLRLLGTDGELFPEPMDMTLYLSTEDQQVYLALYFYGREAPVDRWHSLAETLDHT
jgi:hypothetical protein